MTATVWKYDLAVTDIQSVRMPRGAVILHVAEQYPDPRDMAMPSLQVWAWVDPKAELVDRKFAVVGTGNPAPDPFDGSHVGSVLMFGGQLVWHVFVEDEP